MLNSRKEINTSNTGYKHCINFLTSITGCALFVTLNGLAEFIPQLLDSGFHYALAGKLKSDSIVGEFGIS